MRCGGQGGRDGLRIGGANDEAAEVGSGVAADAVGGRCAFGPVDVGDGGPGVSGCVSAGGGPVGTESAEGESGVRGRRGGGDCAAQSAQKGGGFALARSREVKVEERIG